MMIGHRYPIVCEGFIIPPQSDCISIIHCQIFIYICSLIPVNTTGENLKIVVLAFEYGKFDMKLFS